MLAQKTYGVQIQINHKFGKAKSINKYLKATNHTTQQEFLTLDTYNK